MLIRMASHTYRSDLLKEERAIFLDTNPERGKPPCEGSKKFLPMLVKRFTILGYNNIRILELKNTPHRGPPSKGTMTGNLNYPF